MKANSVTQFLVCCALAVSAGCSTAKPPASPGNLGAAQTTVFWKPDLLYRYETPYRQLDVEVDAVRGCEPTDKTLDRLKDFLATYCKKPDGIQIVREPVIPRSAARGLTADGLACKVMKGPPTNSGGPPPAFLEVLFYDSQLTYDNGIPETGDPGANPALKPSRPVPESQTEWEPYPALIMMNTRGYPKILEGPLLTHEAGHALGLVNRTNYVADHHCTDSNCLMYPKLNAVAVLHIHRLLLGSRAFTYTISQTNLCARCLAELADDAKLPPPTNCYFAGAVMVRSEIGYHVLSLPNRVRVIAGKLAEQDCLDFAAAARKEPALAANGFTTAFIKDEIVSDPVKLNELFQQVASDPEGMVRNVMAAMSIKHGRYTNALKICRQSIRMDPTDDVSYNELAWIEATCPDASLRDGQAAVANATKACQLTDGTAARTWTHWPPLMQNAAISSAPSSMKKGPWPPDHHLQPPKNCWANDFPYTNSRSRSGTNRKSHSIYRDNSA